MGILCSNILNKLGKKYATLSVLYKFAFIFPPHNLQLQSVKQFIADLQLLYQLLQLPLELALTFFYFNGLKKTKS